MLNTHQYCYTNKGYIALLSVLIIGSIVIMIGLSTSLLSINNAQASLATLRNEVAVDMLEGCVEDALLYLNENDALPTNISLPEGMCTVTLNSHTGTEWVFTAETSIATHTKRVQITALRNSNISIKEWVEID